MPPQAEVIATGRLVPRPLREEHAQEAADMAARLREAVAGR